MNRPIHFEINADDPARAERFYETVLGWTFQRWGDQPYWLVTTGPEDEPGINGGMMPRPGPPPVEGAAVNAHLCTVGVADLDAVLRAVTAAGGRVVVPRMPVPGVGWLAYGKDTEGNLLGFMERDETAA